MDFAARAGAAGLSLLLLNACHTGPDTTASPSASTGAEEEVREVGEVEAIATVEAPPEPVHFEQLVGNLYAYCALDDQHRVYCGSADGPAHRIEGLGPVDELVGADRFCARSGSEVSCWHYPGAVVRMERLAGATALAMQANAVCAAILGREVQCDDDGDPRTLASTLTDVIDVSLSSDGDDYQICGLGRDQRVRCEGCAYDWTAFEAEAEVDSGRRYSGTRCTSAPVLLRDEGVLSLDWITQDRALVQGADGRCRVLNQRGETCPSGSIAARFTGYRWEADPGGARVVRAFLHTYALGTDGAVLFGRRDGITTLGIAGAPSAPTHPSVSLPAPIMVRSDGVYVLQADGSVSVLDGSFLHVRTTVTGASEITQAGPDAAARVGTEVWLFERGVASRVVDLEPALTISGNRNELCSVRTDGTLACVSLSGNGHACAGTVTDLLDVDLVRGGACLLDRGGRARCDRQSPCEFLGPREVATGVTRIERRDEARLSLLAEGAVVATYAPDERAPSTWTHCYERPCTCDVIGNEFDCSGMDGALRDVLMVDHGIALLANGSLVRPEYTPDEDAVNLLNVQPRP